MAKPFSPALVGSGLIIAALLAGSAYYTYRTQTLRLKNPAPVVINTSTPKEIAPEPTMTCKELDTSFALSEVEQNFVIRDLEPVQVRFSPFIYPAQNQALILNPGQPSLITIKSSADHSNSIVPVVLATSTTLVDDVRAVMVGQTWFFFSTEEWGLGSGLYRSALYKIADRTLDDVNIPAKYSPKEEEMTCPENPKVLECPGGDANPISATELVGATDAVLVFKTGYNTSTYASFNVTSSRWQDLKADDVILKNLKPSRKSLAKLFTENTCVSQETAFGTLVYSKNNFTKAAEDWYNGLSGYSSVSIYWKPKQM